MTKVTTPIGITAHTSQMILLYLATVGRPVRTSEVRAVIVRYSPDSAVPIYGCLGGLVTAGSVKKLTAERDALLAINEE
jgi:hypothetical protein